MRRDYCSILLEHYNNPQNVGSLDENDKDVGTGTSGTASCGDVLRLQVRIKNGIIEDVKFKTFGCGSAIASSSFLTQLIKGKSLNEVENIKNSDIAKALSLPKIKLHCSVLAEEALNRAISDYWRKNGIEKLQLQNKEMNSKGEIKTMNGSMSITITKAAKDRMFDMIKTQNGKCMLVTVSPGGCKGLMYHLEVCKDFLDGDTILKDDDLEIRIPTGILSFIKGLVIDYCDNGVHAGFKFDNPNQQGCCGCGTSFCV